MQPTSHYSHTLLNRRTIRVAPKIYKLLTRYCISNETKCYLALHLRNKIETWFIFF